MRRMYLLIAIVCWASLPAPIQAAVGDSPARFSITVRGGAGWLWNTDWSRELAAADLELAGENLGPDLTVQNLEDTVPGVIPRFDIEIMYRPTPRLRIGASIGYQVARWETGGLYSARGWSGTRSELRTAHVCDVSLIPLQVLLAYRVIQAGTHALDLTTGLSWNRLDSEWTSTLDRSFTSAFTGQRVRNLQYTDVIDASDSGWGFGAGLDFEEAISTRLALVAAADIRLGPKLTALGRKRQHEQLYSNGELISDYSYPEEDENIPPVSWFDFSGMYFRIGLRIRL